jgi:hypothetical protein
LKASAATPNIKHHHWEANVRMAACVMALLAGATMGVRAQSFINLGFEQAQLSELEHGFLTWGQGAPGWSHNESAEGDYLGYPDVNLGFSVSYALYPLNGCCGTGLGTGAFAIAMHSGTFYEHEPRGAFVQAAVWQTGTIRPGVTTVSLLASAAAFSVSLDGTVIDMRPVGLDITSPTYESDLLRYRGEWTGDVSAFAGQSVEFRVGVLAPDEELSLVIDDIRFLPVPEPSTAVLIGVGMLLVPLAAAWAARATRARRAGRSLPHSAADALFRNGGGR